MFLISTFVITWQGFYWSRRRNRFLTTFDKMSALGLPVDPDYARVMGVPPLMVQDEARAGSILGNCWHFTQGLVIQMIALACFAEQQSLQ